jgi:hypothetical protein
VSGWLRLAVSAAVATALLALVIIVGAHFLERLPAPEPPDAAPPAEPAEPDEVGAALSLSGDLPPERITERDVDELREFLAESPGARLRRSLADSDMRFLGVNGRGVTVPGIEDPERALREGRVLWIPGTSERSISDEHEVLIERSRRYARAYNALLSQLSPPRAGD